MGASPQFVEEIVRFADDLPDELLDHLADCLHRYSGQGWDRLQAAILRQIPQQHVRDGMLQFLDYWQDHHPTTTAEAVALALRVASQASTNHHVEQSIELVWTGPESRYLTLRRTEQALLELIEEAQNRLHIVSFAVYKAESIAAALVNAAQRGVEITIYLETPETSNNRMAFDTVRALGQNILKHVEIYVWPIEKRPKTADSRYGSLHAKVALADGQTMFISSANLTEYAMTLNIELGVLIRGGALPKRMETQLSHLVNEGVLHKLM